MIDDLIARVRSLWRGVTSTRGVNDDLKEEFHLHMELRAADLVREGMSPADAARKARAEFGGTDDHVEQARRARGLAWFDELRFSWLDVKLGGRMLVKYPMLTIVGGFSMAFAIWIGAATFEGVRQFVFPAIPLPDSDRIVVLQNWDAAANEPEYQSTYDFLLWRDAMRSVDDLGAYRTINRNLMLAEDLAEPVATAEVSAAVFRALQVTPLMGRTFVDGDERPGAPVVAVIAHDMWQRQFRADPGIVGRAIRINGVPATVVGVMPDGFAFPSTQELWTPLRVAATGHEPRQGIGIRILGRLAPGASIGQAEAELTRLGQLAAGDSPQTHRYLRPQLMTFAETAALLGEEGLGLLAGNIFVVMLLVLVCANVGLLIFARAAARESELVVRSALGATRQRIVMQLFAEALVLGMVAGVVGLAAAGYGMRWGLALMRSELTDASGNYPFWVDGSLSPHTFAYTAVLVVIAAAVAGIVPALAITRNLADRLRAASAGGGGARFGGVWTVVIVAQLAVTMAFPVVTFFVRKDAVRIETQPLPFSVEQYLVARLEMERYPSEAGADTSAAAFEARYVTASARLEERLRENPEVVGVAFGEHLPRQYHPNNQVEIDEGAVAPVDDRGHRVGSADVDPGFLDLFKVSMLSGRWFTASEASAGARVAVVNKAFVNRIFEGRNPIGRRIRYVTGSSPETQPWHEIIGVAPDMGTNSGWGPAGIYRPLVREEVYPLNIAVQLRGDPETFAARLRAIGTDVDPTLRLAEAMPLRDVVNGEVAFHAFWVRMTAIISGVVLLLSLVTIYAVMSFAVSRQRREIGVRIALGASPRRIIAAVFAHPLRQLGLGVVAGALLVAYLTGMAKSGGPSAGALLTLIGYTALVAAVCMVACVIPTRKALSVNPIETLREQ